MGSGTLHREDVKAALRKRHGSVRAFEMKRGLPLDSVSDVLRGRTVAQTIKAVAEDLKIDPSAIRNIGKNGAPQSDESDNSAEQRGRHRLNARQA